MNGEAEDDASVEGAVIRHLFRTESDSEDVECSEDPESASGEDALVERSVMNLVLAEKLVGGSVSERLWPAARCLADFVLSYDSAFPSKVLRCHMQETQQQQQQQQHARASLTAMMLRVSPERPLSVLELGAGTGLTGMQIATEIPCRVLVTDLEEALPLLRRNIDSNRDKFLLGSNAVVVQTLRWGDPNDTLRALEWHSSRDPLLVLASDCVYFRHLHAPLERTLCLLLSQAPRGSVGLIAGARRWKRDNAFYAKLGRKTKTTTHQLHCTCLQETVTRQASGKGDAAEREILRVYAVQWLPRIAENQQN